MATNNKTNASKNTNSPAASKTKSAGSSKSCCTVGKASGKSGFGSNAKSSTSSSASGSKAGGAKKGTQGGVNAVLAKGTGSKSKMEAGGDQNIMKDADIITDILGGQKALIKLYGTALCECDDPKLRTIFSSQMSEAATDQFDAFLYMNQRGLYPTERAPAPKVKQAIKQFTNKGASLKK